MVHIGTTAQNFVLTLMIGKLETFMPAFLILYKD